MYTYDDIVFYSAQNCFVYLFFTKFKSICECKEFKCSRVLHCCTCEDLNCLDM